MVSIDTPLKKRWLVIRCDLLFCEANWEMKEPKTKGLEVEEAVGGGDAKASEVADDAAAGDGPPKANDDEGGSGVGVPNGLAARPGARPAARFATRKSKPLFGEPNVASGSCSPSGRKYTVPPGL